MEAYEFYWLDPKGGYQIIGVLPERRRNPERITKVSVMKWGAKIFGKDFDTKDIFAIQVKIDENTIRIFRPIPFSISQKEI
jgi:hypothetical protein